MARTFKQIGRLKTLGQFEAYLAELGLQLPVDPAILSGAEDSPMARPCEVGGRTVGNRWCIHPMEGWDANRDGSPSEHTFRRWGHFGQSGAKLIWGGEAFAVREDGRSNPNQLAYRPEHADAMKRLVENTVKAHVKVAGSVDDLLIGLQLTHSGRYSKPADNNRHDPLIVYHHPVLDQRVKVSPDDDSSLLSDDDIRGIRDCYIAAAKQAHEVGFHFVDIKHCHGYFAHELLSAYDRPGDYGGSFENRTRFLREVIEGVRSQCPGMLIGVRLAAFDMPPFHPDPEQTDGGRFGPGIPEPHPTPYPGFGCSREDPTQIDLAEPIRLVRLMQDEWGVDLVNITAGSPYYNPHIQRPAYHPPSDGYQPPEDPLVGCVRQMTAARQLHEAAPKLPMVGSGYTYFQEYLPQVAQAVVREGWIDFVGVGRMVLSYWEMPWDTLSGAEFQSKRICRTFSDCTTAPRNGIISGCYPLDDHYKNKPQFVELKNAKQALREKLKAEA